LPATLSHYEKESEEFLHIIITADEKWLHHYETKSISPWNIITKVHLRIKIQNPGFSVETHGNSFLEHRLFYSHGLTRTWDHHQLRVLHWNVQTSEIMIKKGSEAQEHFAAT
jgi:hypothetical protein